MVDECGATLQVLRLKDHVGDLFDDTHGHALALPQGEEQPGPDLSAAFFGIGLLGGARMTG